MIPPPTNCGQWDGAGEVRSSRPEAFLPAYSHTGIWPTASPCLPRHQQPLSFPAGEAKPDERTSFAISHSSPHRLGHARTTPLPGASQPGSSACRPGGQLEAVSARSPSLLPPPLSEDTGPLPLSPPIPPPLRLASSPPHGLTFPERLRFLGPLAVQGALDRPSA